MLIGQRFCLVLDLPTLEVVGGCGGWTTTLSYYRCTHPLISGVGSRVTSVFTPYPLFQWYLQSKKEIFIKSQYEMLKLSI